MKKVLLLGTGVLVCLALATWTYSAQPNNNGIVKLSLPNYAAQLQLSGIKNPISVPPTGQSFPPGQYTVTSFTLLTRDAGGKTWSINGYPASGKAITFSVQAGQTTTLDLGPPFEVVADATNDTDVNKQKVLVVAVAITGRGGEHYAYSSMVTPNGQAPAPKIMIVAENNTMLHQGTFEYG